MCNEHRKCTPPAVNQDSRWAQSSAWLQSQQQMHKRSYAGAQTMAGAHEQYTDHCPPGLDSCVLCAGQRAEHGVNGTHGREEEKEAALRLGVRLITHSDMWTPKRHDTQHTRGDNSTTTINAQSASLILDSLYWPWWVRLTSSLSLKTWITIFFMFPRIVYQLRIISPSHSYWVQHHRLAWILFKSELLDGL